VLLPFLLATDTISGLLITFLIDKHAGTLFDGSASGKKSIPDSQFWKAAAFEKVRRIATFGALLLAGLSKERQHVLWITDQDDIVGNPSQHSAATRVLGHHINCLTPHNLGHIRLATTKSDTGRRDVEDLAAIPDLVAGATAEVATLLYRNSDTPGVLRPIPQCTDKARTIVAWLANESSSLKRLVFVLESEPPEKFRVRQLLFKL
jgi:hypothetical protein